MVQSSLVGIALVIYVVDCSSYRQCLLGISIALVVVLVLYLGLIQQGNGSLCGMESSSCFSYRSEARMIRTIVRISIFTSEDTKRSGVSERVEIHTLMRIRMNNEVFE